MIVTLLTFAGGMAAGPIVLRAWPRQAPRNASVGVRWERNRDADPGATTRLYRRDMPTHDVVANVRFLDVVTPRGGASVQAAKRLRDWRVEALLVDKRTGAVDQVLIHADDADLDEKRDILRRVGLKTMVLERKTEKAEA